MKKAEAKKVKMYGAPATTNAPAKLLPESVDDATDGESSSKPLLSDNDARCYTARYYDAGNTKMKQTFPNWMFSNSMLLSTSSSAFKR